jgi:hypothetical protein
MGSCHDHIVTYQEIQTNLLDISRLSFAKTTLDQQFQILTVVYNTKYARCKPVKGFTRTAIILRIFRSYPWLV